MAIAVLVRPRGNQGELTAVSLSSKPERFAKLQQSASVRDGAEYDVERVWEHDGTTGLQFRGIDSINDAEKLRGAEVRVPVAERVPLDEGEYFHSDLIGCEVRDRASDRLIGRVTGWEEYGGPALLEWTTGAS